MPDTFDDKEPRTFDALEENKERLTGQAGRPSCFQGADLGDLNEGTDLGDLNEGADLGDLNEGADLEGLDNGMSEGADTPEETAVSEETCKPEGSGKAFITESFIGISATAAGPVYFIPKGNLAVAAGDKVLIQLEHGLVFGEVTSIRELTVHQEIIEAYPAVFDSLATAEDIARHAENKILSAEAAAFCTTCIRQRELDMKLVDVEVLHDRSKLIFYFTAPSRIDFRELVKDLVNNYRTRIELRQIGVRHETQMIGGIGNCGMVCCCHRYLRKFAPVTIKMAKEQNLFLNPVKLSGMCGRLLCCLSFEQSNYEEFNRKCPKFGKSYITEKGNIRPLRANMFRQTVTVLSENNEESDIPLEDWLAMEPKRAEQSHHERQPRKDKPRRDNEDEHGQSDHERHGGKEGAPRSGGGRPRSKKRKNKPRE